MSARQFPQYLAALIATGYAFATGMALGWTSPIESKTKDGSLGFSVTNEEFSWVGSGFPLGAIVGSIPTGFQMDVIGRRLTAILSVLKYLIGWLLIVFAEKSWRLIFARVILGIASGETCVVIPMYVGEIAQKEIRGTLSSFFQFQITIGILVIYVIGAFLEPMPMNVICAIVPVVFTIPMIFMPESPLFLVKKDKLEQAEKSFRWLRGKDYDIKAEIEATKEDIAQSKQSGSFFQGFKNPACSKALFISIGLMLFEQFSGIYAVIFYSTDIFKYGGSTLEPSYSTIIIGVVQVLATFMAVVFVDRLGRRLLLMVSSGFMSVSTLVLQIYFYLHENKGDLVKNVGWLPVTCLCIYIIMFSFGFGTVPWIMVGELFPPEVKGPAASLAITSNWLWAFIVAKIYPSLKDAIGAGPTFWLFSALTMVGFIFVIFLVPETKNKSLSEIQDMLKGEKLSNTP